MYIYNFQVNSLEGSRASVTSEPLLFLPLMAIILLCNDFSIELNSSYNNSTRNIVRYDLHSVYANQIRTDVQEQETEKVFTI